MTLEKIYARGELAEIVDLTTTLDPDAFDGVVRAVEAVITASEELSLDARADRQRLTMRLLVALGAAPPRGIVIKYDAKAAHS